MFRFLSSCLDSQNMLKFSFEFEFFMYNKEDIIREGVGHLQNFHARTVNTSHPMVYGSVSGILVVALIFITLVFFNINPDIYGLTLSNAEALKYTFQSSTIFPLFIIFLFLFCSFKLSLQGIKLSFFKAVLMFFKLSKYKTHNLWTEYWIKEGHGENFISKIKGSQMTNKDFHTNDAKSQFAHILSSELASISENDFESFILAIFNDLTIDNRINSITKNKSAIFADVTTESENPQVIKFRNFIIPAYSQYKESLRTPFIENSSIFIKLINCIPFLILAFYLYFTVACIVTWQTPLFIEQQRLLEFTLDASLFFGIIYSIVAFWFLRRTEEWRIFWQAKGIDFLLSFHSLGNNKVPPFILPDTTFYTPSDYYKVIEATRELSLKTLYNDNRNMFFDNAEYQFVKISNILYQSYNVHENMVKLKHNKKTRVIHTNF